MRITKNYRFSLLSATVAMGLLVSQARGVSAELPSSPVVAAWFTPVSPSTVANPKVTLQISSTGNYVRIFKDKACSLPISPVVGQLNPTVSIQVTVSNSSTSIYAKVWKVSQSQAVCSGLLGTYLWIAPTPSPSPTPSPTPSPSPSPTTSAAFVAIHPMSNSAYLGQTVRMSVAASGTAPLSYQWLKNGGPIVGATAASYTTPPAAASDNNATFRCRVTNASGSSLSEAGKLTLVARAPLQGTVVYVDASLASASCNTYDPASRSCFGGTALAYKTIQACADTTSAGRSCAVQAGNYSEHVITKAGGSGEASRIIFQAQGNVSMQGFEIRHPYVTVDGFDLTGYSAGYLGLFTIKPQADACSLINNSLRDGNSNVYGIVFSSSGGVSAIGCVVRGNRLNNLKYHFLSTFGAGHLFENNSFENLNGWDAIRVFGRDHVFRRNIFRLGVPLPGQGNHPDWIQTFSDNGGESSNMLFEENWVEDLNSQLGQLNSGGGLRDPRLSPDFHDFYFRRNVFIAVSNNMNGALPGLQFDHNTFYRVAYTQSGVGLGSSLTRGDASRGLVKNNVFSESGLLPDPQRLRGFYSLSGGILSKEALAAYVTGEDLWADFPYPLAKSVFDDLVVQGYITANGGPLAKAKSLVDISQFAVSAANAGYKALTYDVLLKAVALDNSTRSSFVNDNNYVAGGKAEGYPTKRYFAEAHGVNGGDPAFQNIANPMGPDGIPFTLDDGLKPRADSPLCGRGEYGKAIGAYSCDPTVVLAK